jgi:FKBP-type peptidyl-prolyl cis-trans isomerase
MRTESGLEYEILKVGDGPLVREGYKISIHYEIALSVDDLVSRRLIDSSYRRGAPFEFTVGRKQVLQGVDEGVLDMHTGELRRLIIPPAMAFGSRGAKGVVPPGATLLVDVKLRYIVSRGTENLTTAL